MSIHRLISLAAMGAVVACAASSLPSIGQDAGTSSLKTLREGFVNPPAEARLRCYWWWLNGNTDKATITHDLEEMKAKGYGGALLVDAGGANQGGHAGVPAGPMFGSPAWVELYTHTLREADRLGLEITLNIMSGWNLGGPFVKPEQASKVLTFSRVDVVGGRHLVVSVSKPPTKNGFYRDIALLAYPLHHGKALAPQPSDGQGDRHTVQEHRLSSQLSRTLQYRAAAVEGGFSMPNTSAMLNDGLSHEFAGDPHFADATLREVKNLTASMKADGSIETDLPSGDWELLRVGYTDSDARVSTSSDTWQGLAIDYLSRDAFDAYWKRSVEPLLVAAKPFHSLKYLATDSWELGGTNWTEGFAEKFKALRGYDPVAYLPIVAGRILEDRSVSTRFLTDLRRTVGDLVASEHYDHFAERAKQYGLGVQAESGGPHGAPIDALETFRSSAVPQTEFWSQNQHRSRDTEKFFTKEAASAAHIYGQRFVAQEGETSIGPQWTESLAADLKPAFDMGITEGMNRLVWHEFTSSPANTGLPGQEYFAGTHLNPKVTWWNAGSAFFQYLNRVQFLMQQGTAVSDVLYFYGDHVPNFVRLKADDPAKVLPGYDYDVTNEDALLHFIKIRGAVLEGPSGVRWRVLALPVTRRISVPVLRFVERYLQAGGAVVSLPPESTTGNIDTEKQQEFDALVKRIWANCAEGENHSYGKGMVYCTSHARAALEKMNVPQDVALVSRDGDVEFSAASDRGIDYIHRHVAGNEIYFVRSAYATSKHVTLAFRATGAVEIWNPLTADFAALDTKTKHAGVTEVPLDLAAFGSSVVVFRKEARTELPLLKQSARTVAFKAVDGWTVTFQKDRGVAAKPVHVNELTSWTTWTMPGVKYFSGTATYQTTFGAPALSAGEKLCLSFGDVHEIARVAINGKPVGTVWANPHSICLKEPLRAGKSNLQIEVTNLWHNRLIGDAQLPKEQRIMSTNISIQPNEKILPSGLIGPVEWVVMK